MKKILILVVALLCVPVDGVTQERNPLTGVSAMGHLPNITWSDLITGVSEESFTQAVESAFELGLLRTGMTVQEGVQRNYLECNIQFLAHPRDRGNIVSYVRKVQYWERGEYAGRLGFGITWHQQSLGISGIDNLSGTRMGEWCAETFELDWRRANN